MIKEAKKIDLSPGDLVFYRPHRAFGLLLRRTNPYETVWWRYALLSPPDLGFPSIVTTQTVEEAKFLKAIEDGDLEHYAKKG